MTHVDIHYTAKLVLLYLYTVNCQLHIENVALTGTCSMTDRFTNTGDCTEVIDNVTDLNLGFGNTPNCIITTDNLQTGCLPFWQVVLKEEYTITNITIFNRAGSTERLTYTNVTVNGILCKSFGSDRSIIQDVNTFQCSSPIRGRTVTISRHYPTCSTSGDFTLNLCEVQVWVCSKGWYGNDCSTPCSGHCSNNATCDRYDGLCPIGCNSGWYGSKCNYSCPVNCKGACNQSSGACFECNGTRYGQTCQEDCGHCFLKEVCNMENGHCSKCEPGWDLPQCKKECNDSYYGQNCTSKCGHCSQGVICNKTDGSCLSCEPGWERPLCAQECNESYYGQNCTAKCGHCSQGQICNRTDGSCLSCEPGWEPPLCAQECRENYYGQNCTAICGHCSQGQICNRTDGSCLSCEPGWERPLCIQAANCARPAQSNCDGSQVGVGIGSAVSGAIVVIIAEVLLFLVYRWRRNSKRKQATERVDQSVSDDIHLQVQYSSSLRNEEIPCAEITHLESSYDKLESNALYENSKEQSVYTGLKKD